MNIFLFQVREIGVTIDPDAVHDVIDSLFRLGRNASDYSPLTPQQACSVQCIVWGNRKRSIDLTIVAEIQNFNPRFFCNWCYLFCFERSARVFLHLHST